MTTRVVPVAVFERWLAKEYRKQQARSSTTNTVAKYRMYAVGNALAIWQRNIAALANPDATLTAQTYREFYTFIKRGSNSNVSKGTTEGYDIVLRMLSRVGVTF